jgi:peptide subunit release factor 1 (eRF1)
MHWLSNTHSFYSFLSYLTLPNYSDGPVDLEVRNKESFVEWLTTHYKDYGAKLQFVTDRSQEGAQFCQVSLITFARGIQSLFFVFLLYLITS